MRGFLAELPTLLLVLPISSGLLNTLDGVGDLTDLISGFLKSDGVSGLLES